MIRFLCLLIEIEEPLLVRTCHHAVLASYAALVTLKHKTAFHTLSFLNCRVYPLLSAFRRGLIRGIHRAYLNAGRILAVVADNRHDACAHIRILPLEYSDNAVPFHQPSLPIILWRARSNAVLSLACDRAC